MDLPWETKIFKLYALLKLPNIAKMEPPTNKTIMFIIFYLNAVDFVESNFQCVLQFDRKTIFEIFLDIVCARGSIS